MLALVAGGLVLGTAELSRCPQLVAFVPTRVTEAARLHENAAFRWMEAREAEGSGFRSVQTVAVMRASHEEIPVQAKARTRSQHAPRARQSAPDSSAALGQPEFVSLAATSTESPSAGQQQWIVFTAWSQVSVSRDKRDDWTASSAVSDSDSSKQQEAQGNVKSAPRQGERKIVAPVILRILPANFMIDRLDLERVSSGWLVFQL